MEKEVYVLGVGHNSITFIDLLLDCGYKVKGLYNYNHERIGEKYFDYTIDGCFEDLLNTDIKGKHFILSMGDIAIRRTLFERIKAKGGIFPALIHPSAVVSKYCQYGEGFTVLANSVVQADTRIGDNVVITFNSSISHTSTIGSHCFISGNCLVGAFSNIGNEVHLGQSSTLVSGTEVIVGDKCSIGAGSVVRGSTKSNSIYLGNPARFIKAKP